MCAMKDYARGFYLSKAWKDCRRSYMKKAGGLCERCLANGIITPAEIVHHKIEINEDNIDDPNITLSHSNLMAVCRECHAFYHTVKKKRYTVDESGYIRPLR